MKQKRLNRSEWEDPRNWSDNFLGLYFSKRDSRVWVPKRRPMLGWTINLAHPRAVWWILGIALIPTLFSSVRRFSSSDGREGRKAAEHW
jgi:uncharacterized membrane protein